jgi:hypothetical protein
VLFHRKKEAGQETEPLSALLRGVDLSPEPKDLISSMYLNYEPNKLRRCSKANCRHHGGLPDGVSKLDLEQEIVN